MNIYWSKVLLLIGFAFITPMSKCMDDASDDDSAASYHSAMQDAPSDDESASESSGEECVICLEPLIGERTFALSPCNHTFHQECIDRALNETDARCPLCRTAPDNIPDIAERRAAIQQQRNQQNEQAMQEYIEAVADDALATNLVYPMMSPTQRTQVRQQLIQRLLQEQRQALQLNQARHQQPDAWARPRAINARNRGHINMLPRPIIPVGIPENNAQRTWQRPACIVALLGIITYLFKDTLLSAIFGEDDTDEINLSDFASSQYLRLLDFIEQTQKDNTHENDTVPNQPGDKTNGLPAASKVS